MSLVAIAAALVASGFIFTAFIQRRQARASYYEVVPAGVALALGIVALTVDNARRGVFDMTEIITFVAAVILLIGGGIVALLEQPRGSRAVWGMSAGAILLVLTLALPVIAARNALPEQLATRSTPTPGPTPTTQDVAADVYRSVIGVVADETGYRPADISDRLDSGEASIADIVYEAAGDLERVIQGIADVMSDAVQGLVVQGVMDSTQAAAVISALELIVRAGVELNLSNLMDRFEQVVTFD